MITPEDRVPFWLSALVVFVVVAALLGVGFVIRFALYVYGVDY